MDPLFQVYMFYLLAVPALVFLRQRLSAFWCPLALAVAVALLPLTVFAINFLSGNLQHIMNECWVYWVYFMAMPTVLSVVYVGWWELLRRAISAELFLELKQNLKHGIFGFIIISISVVLTILGAACFFCEPCIDSLLSVFLETIGYMHANIIPLVCF